jgi:hypothetical protein
MAKDTTETYEIWYDTVATDTKGAAQGKSQRRHRLADSEEQARAIYAELVNDTETGVQRDESDEPNPGPLIAHSNIVVTKSSTTSTAVKF